MKTVFLLSVLIGSLCPSTSISVDTYLTDRDKAQLKNVLVSGLESENVSNIFYAVAGLKLLDQPIPNVQDICNTLVKLVSKSKSLDSVYFSTSAWKTIGVCSGTLVVDESVQDVYAMLEKKDIRDVHMSDLYFGVSVLNNLNLKPKDISKLINIIKRKMKSDDSIADFGYSIHLLSSLGPDGRFAFNRLSDALMQVDQVDRKYLQFEGGLSITALVLTGVYKFCDAVVCNTSFPIQNDQALMFSNYLLSRKSVQTPKGAYFLVNALKTLTNNQYHMPIVATLVKPMGDLDDVVQKTLSVRFTNLLGEPLPASLSVGVESAMLNNKVVMSKNKFKTTADKTVYELDFNEPDLSTGIYSLVISATPIEKVKTPLVGNSAIPIEVKVSASKVNVVDFKVGTTDNDQQTGASLQILKYGEKLTTQLKADHMQRIIVRFTIKDHNNKKNVQVHQAFVRFTNNRSGAQNVFVAELDSQNNYKLDMDLGVKATSFKHASDLYTMDLIIGDFLLKKPIVWQFCDIKLKFPETPFVPSVQFFYKPKKLISHTFREPETRPHQFVSLIFTALSLLPLLVLFVLWARLGVNIKNFPFNLSAIGFHLSLASIFVLFGMFWVYLDMFKTLKYLSLLGLLTFLFGNRLLSYIARRRSK